MTWSSLTVMDNSWVAVYGKTTFNSEQPLYADVYWRCLEFEVRIWTCVCVSGSPERWTFPPAETCPSCFHKSSPSLSSNIHLLISPTTVDTPCSHPMSCIIYRIWAYLVLISVSSCSKSPTYILTKHHSAQQVLQHLFFSYFFHYHANRVVLLREWAQ